MMRLSVCGIRSILFFCVVVFLGLGLPAGAQEDVRKTYESLKAFELTGGAAQVENLVLKRDRVEMRFTGTFYFESPVAGAVRGTVFSGQGSFRVEPSPNKYEQANIKRILREDVIEREFRSAVLRFTDDTVEQLAALGANITVAGTPAAEQHIATEFNTRMMKSSGANVASRLVVSILNGEKPGFFLAEFDTTRRRERMTFVMDYQGRMLTDYFGVNGGEKGVVWRYISEWEGGDVLTAFYSLEDYKKGWVQHSDVFDVVYIRGYKMDLDLRERGQRMEASVEMKMEVLADGVRAIPLLLKEGLSEYDEARLKYGMHVKSTRLSGGGELLCLTEDWDGGLLLVLPQAARKGDIVSAVVDSGGRYLFQNPGLPSVQYPRSSGGFYPRHGYLQRSTYELTARHRRGEKVVSIGVLAREEPAGDHMVTQWKMDIPVMFTTFGVGTFKALDSTIERTDGPLPIVYHALPGGIIRGADDQFIAQELRNTMRFFNELFGEYPYPIFSALFHPRGYGQGLPTLLLLPVRDQGYFARYTLSFLAHETAHQWWGNIVGWRSYRDQWLSEGFAEYSGILFTARRRSYKESLDLVDDMRLILKDAPRGQRSGRGQGKLGEIGPLTMGHRNSTRETGGAYTALIYAKGGLVLRMLHFLFMDPQSGDGSAFFTMMKDFVDRHRDQTATTESFIAVANEHFARTPVARRYNLKDLNWFFDQWVFQARLPSYRLEYKIEPQPDGSVMVNGTLHQENAEENWLMPLPLVFTFGRDQVAKGLVMALGPANPVSIRLPRAPSKVELDPDMWVISENTSTRQVR